MNVLFTDVMTVYNYYRNGETEGWSRSVVRGVQWSHNRTEVTVADGVQSEGKVERVTVDFQRGYGNKAYLSPEAYRRLPPDQCGDFWTLDAGTGQDIMVLGISEREVDREYRISALKKDFQYAVTVTAVSDNRNRRMLKQIKVVGK
ncbi:MAG: hypothetical protein NC489_19670 [Ruminococcus flavefaciens]|nr:hypothetical protein [Ruminococcus flavefaciens]